MGLPTTPPSDAELSFIEWVVGGAYIAIGGLIWIVWRAASKVSDMSGGIGQNQREIGDLRLRQNTFEARMKEIGDIGDRRHDENIKALSNLPDMTDFRRLEDRMYNELQEIKKIVQAQH